MGLKESKGSPDLEALRKKLQASEDAFTSQQASLQAAQHVCVAHVLSIWLNSRTAERAHLLRAHSYPLHTCDWQRTSLRGPLLTDKSIRTLDAVSPPTCSCHKLTACRRSWSSPSRRRAASCKAHRQRQPSSWQRLSSRPTA